MPCMHLLVVNHFPHKSVDGVLTSTQVQCVAWYTKLTASSRTPVAENADWPLLERTPGYVPGPLSGSQWPITAQWRATQWVGQWPVIQCHGTVTWRVTLSVGWWVSGTAPAGRVWRCFWTVVGLAGSAVGTHTHGHTERTAGARRRQCPSQALRWRPFFALRNADRPLPSRDSRFTDAWTWRPVCSCTGGLARGLQWSSSDRGDYTYCE